MKPILEFAATAKNTTTKATKGHCHPIDLFPLVSTSMFALASMINLFVFSSISPKPKIMIYIKSPKEEHKEK